MRIIGGEFKGRKLKEFSNIGVRPTSDMVRESVFNILNQVIEGASFLDLFAGTGAMGIEAYSRGADKVCFNDNSLESKKLLKANLSSLNIENKVTTYSENALSLLSFLKEKFDVVYVDPPYNMEGIDKVIQAAKNVIDTGVIILETEKPFNVDIQGLKIVDSRRYGRANLTFFKKRVKQDKCLFAGTFDPVTIGHVNLVKEILKDFNSVLIGVGVNSEKTPFYSLEERLNFLNLAFSDMPVEIKAYNGLTVNFMKENGVKFTARGIRDKKDLKYEKKMAEFNKSLALDITTLFYNVSGEYSKISSSVVRDRIKNNLDLNGYLPEKIIPIIKKNNQ
ncbi:MAG: 16S rRNA (guanine(966)-N(2))-methyltransferase RsmD [Clostridia bacterium]|nr:16S rRNA (guanine(966)-N(2))-methyltransferase RsmD [Clostridia bacterium]